MRFVLDDGGRQAAGYRGVAGDCVVRAIAIATQQPYPVVYAALKGLARLERPRLGRHRSTVRDGVARTTIGRYMAGLGWEWVPTMRVGSGCQVHLRPDELPQGRLVVSLSRHLAAVVDGVLRDTYDCSRDGTRCVYGYWRQPVGGQPCTK